MAIHFKAFLYETKPTKSKEIRRFAVEEDACSNFEYLKKKVGSTFPNLGESFSLQWKDADGDLIWFNSDEELLHALTQHTPGDVFKLYVKEHGSKEKEKCQERVQPDFSQWRSQFGQFNSRDPPRFFGGSSFGVPPNMSRWGCPMQNRPPFDDRNQTSPHPPTAGQSQPPPHSQPSQSQEDRAKNYLETMGNAVADMLHPLGIDVDVDIEHNGERTKCSGAQNTAPQQPVPQPTEPTKDQPTSSAHASQTKSDKEDQENTSDPEWTFVKSEDSSPPQPEQSGTTDSAADVTMMIVKEARLQNALNQLVGMGFREEEWLVNLIKACDYDINLVLDSMRPGGGHQT